jgi:hypothetical protein
MKDGSLSEQSLSAVENSGVVERGYESYTERVARSENSSIWMGSISDEEDEDEDEETS